MEFINNISLPISKINEINNYKSFGQKWIDKAVRSAKASIYIDTNLVKVKDDSGQVGRCCYAGTIIYARKDGEDITDNDIAALLLIDRGQENGVKKRTEKEVTIHWLCDSSD